MTHIESMEQTLKSLDRNLGCNSVEELLPFYQYGMGNPDMMEFVVELRKKVDELLDRLDNLPDLETIDKVMDKLYYYEIEDPKLLGQLLETNRHIAEIISSHNINPDTDELDDKLTELEELKQGYLLTDEADEILQQAEAEYNMSPTEILSTLVTNCISTPDDFVRNTYLSKEN